MDFLDLQSNEKGRLASEVKAFIISQDYLYHLVKGIYMRVIRAFADWSGNYRFVTTTNAHIQKLLDPVARAIKDSVLQAVNRTHTDGSKKHAAAVEAVNAVLGKVRKKANKWFNRIYGPVHRAETVRLQALLAANQAKLEELKKKQQELASEVRLLVCRHLFEPVPCGWCRQRMGWQLAAVILTTTQRSIGICWLFARACQPSCPACLPTCPHALTPAPCPCFFLLSFFFWF
jgi:hypothetical protein